MIIHHFDINTPDGKLPERDGWEQLPNVNIFELVAGWGRICLNLAGAINFGLINVHAEKYGDMIYRFLKDKYDPVINLKGGGVGIVDGFLPMECHDGIQLYRRKALVYN